MNVGIQTLALACAAVIAAAVYLWWRGAFTREQAALEPEPAEEDGIELDDYLRDRMRTKVSDVIAALNLISEAAVRDPVRIHNELKVFAPTDIDALPFWRAHVMAAVKLRGDPRLTRAFFKACAMLDPDYEPTHRT